jgi:hypothetical protein
VERSKATMSNLVKEMIDEEDGPDNVPEIPLPNV